MNIAKDNYFQSCPAIMNYSPFTDYRGKDREEYVKSINKMESAHTHRLFMQNNASRIMDSEWNVLNNTYTCKANVCVHNAPTRQPHGSQWKELRLHNAARSGLAPFESVKCPRYESYRMC